MRAIRAKESRVLGCLCVFGFLLMSVVAVLELQNGVSFSSVTYLALVMLAGWLAAIGLRAQAIYLDGKDLLVEGKPRRFRRVVIAEVVTVRTIPLVYSLDILWIKSSSRRKSMTVVRRHDLRWLMSMMPEAAITAYWRRQN